jgi:hypothetical protein
MDVGEAEPCEFRLCPGGRLVVVGGASQARTDVVSQVPIVVIGFARFVFQEGEVSIRREERFARTQAAGKQAGGRPAEFQKGRASWGDSTKRCGVDGENSAAIFNQTTKRTKTA